MNQPYFIVVLAHSLHGKIRRFHIDQKIIFAVLGLALLGCFTLFGMVSSYLRMAWKVSQYNRLQAQTDALRARYQDLLKESSQKSNQVEQLQLLASEVSMAYGIKRAPGTTAAAAGPAHFSEARLAGPVQPPSFSESLAEYNLLKSANLNVFGNSYARRYLVHSRPSLWPVLGRLLGHFGRREDPFNGMQAFHSGVDIAAVTGTPVRATADGIVVTAEYSGGGYGKLICIDHGGGMETCYAHLSRIDVLPGQEVRMGQFIGATGATGRVTSPHLHYEVRVGGSPIDPHSFLEHSYAGPTTQRTFGF